MPEEISQSIKTRFAGNGDLTKDIIMSPVNTSGFVLGNQLQISDDGSRVYGNIPEVEKDAMSALQGLPITYEEWLQVTKLFAELNKAGFQHTDLIHNLFFRRNEQQKLVLTIIDFEYRDNYYADDNDELTAIGIMLLGIGARVTDF